MLPWQTLSVPPLEPAHPQGPFKVAWGFAVECMMKTRPSPSLRPSRQMEKEIGHDCSLTEMQKFSPLGTVEKGDHKFQLRVPFWYMEKSQMLLSC